MAPRPRVVRDPDHPEFPHGTSAGRLRGCDRDCCVIAKRRQSKRNRVARSRGVSRWASPELTTAALAAVEAARAAEPGLSYRAMGRLTGTTGQQVKWFVEGSVRRSRFVAERLMRLNPDTVHETMLVVPVEPVIRQVREMQALGWPLRWQAEQVGGGRSLLTMLARYDRGRQTTATAATAEAVRRLYVQVGGRPATPRPGLLPGSIKQARTTAERWRAAHDQPRSLDVERRCVTRLHAAAGVAVGKFGDDVSVEVGLSSRGVQRAAGAVGLTRFPHVVPGMKNRGDKVIEYLFDDVGDYMAPLVQQAWLAVQCGGDAVEQWQSLTGMASALRDPDVRRGRPCAEVVKELQRTEDGDGQTSAA